jgi:hypothetical protein
MRVQFGYRLGINSIHSLCLTYCNVLHMASNRDGSGRMIGRLMALSIAIYVSCEV